MADACGQGFMSTARHSHDEEMDGRAELAMDDGEKICDFGVCIFKGCIPCILIAVEIPTRRDDVGSLIDGPDNASCGIPVMTLSWPKMVKSGVHATAVVSPLLEPQPLLSFKLVQGFTYSQIRIVRPIQELQNTHSGELIFYHNINMPPSDVQKTSRPFWLCFVGEEAEIYLLRYVYFLEMIHRYESGGKPTS
jgi:hypothetical protein